jgi:hypothetical protein
LEEIRKMITRLPEIEETPWGKQLKEKWTAEARAEIRDEIRAEARAEIRAKVHADGLRQMIQKSEEHLKHYGKLFRTGGLSEAAYHDLVARSEKKLGEDRAELERIQSQFG